MNRESKILTLVMIMLIGSVVALLFIGDMKPLILIFVIFAFILLYLAGLFLLRYQDKQLKILRKEAANYDFTKPGETHISAAYLEGEIGKLASDIDQMMQRLSEDTAKEKKQKEFLRDIISDISHQLKTPLASLTVFNDLLMETAEKAGDEKALNMLRQQESQLERMKWLILSLLQMTRIEADAVPFEMQEVPADVLLKLAMEPLEQMAEKKNIKFVIENQSEENAKNYVNSTGEKYIYQDGNCHASSRCESGRYAGRKKRRKEIKN